MQQKFCSRMPVPFYLVQLGAIVVRRHPNNTLFAFCPVFVESVDAHLRFPLRSIDRLSLHRSRAVPFLAWGDRRILRADLSGLFHCR
eukprot:6176677-Pleurochrysis_carterae.AAC.1